MHPSLGSGMPSASERRPGVIPSRSLWFAGARFGAGLGSVAGGRAGGVGKGKSALPGRLMPAKGRLRWQRRSLLSEFLDLFAIVTGDARIKGTWEYTNERMRQERSYREEQTAINVVRIDSTNVDQCQSEDMNTRGFFTYTQTAPVPIAAHPKRQQGHLVGLLMASECLIGPRRGTA